MKTEQRVSAGACDVSDIFVLKRFVAGQPITVENTCAAYGP